MQSSNNNSVQVFSGNYLENISDAFKFLYTEEQLSDVTIYCKEGSVRAHKLVLAANSSYFYRIFRENRKEHHVVIMQGTTLEQLRNLMDILYKGNANVTANNVEVIASLVNEFEIKGVVFGNATPHNVKIENIDQNNSDGIDTRFKGQKRVAVDYDQNDDNCTAKKPNQNLDGCSQLRKYFHEMLTTTGDSKAETTPTPVPASSHSENSTNEIGNKKVRNGNEAPKLNAWARKQRKFKCSLCPSSFKRSSHLTRHQLVHTGERPYACNQCDKAFSRHDKLKHHIKKAHEFIPDSMYERIDADEMGAGCEETEGANDDRNVEFGTANSSASSNNGFERETSPLFTISHITSILEDSFVTPPKKSRGRPRKLQPANPNSTMPLVQPAKRGRGRPRLNQVIFPPSLEVQNYPTFDYNNSNQNDDDDRISSSENANMLEPLVEIKTDTNEMRDKNVDVENDTSEMDKILAEKIAEREKVENGKNYENDENCDEVNIKEIETKIGLIGECTISVANS